jgi:hypothetical protein
MPEERERLERRFPSERVVDERQRDAPGLPDRGVPAGQRQRPERGQRGERPS